jgi:hypothetical protein
MKHPDEVKAAIHRDKAKKVEEQAEEFRQLSAQLGGSAYDLSLAYNVAHESLKKLGTALRARAAEFDESARLTR